MNSKQKCAANIASGVGIAWMGNDEQPCLRKFKTMKCETRPISEKATTWLPADFEYYILQETG